VSSCQTEAVFGSWSSPITAEMLVSGAKGINEVIPDGTSVWWAESRPEEGGRVAIMRWQDDHTHEITPPAANVRTLMHEYGGGSWWVKDGVLWYVDYSDQRIWEIKNGHDPLALTADPVKPKSQRYADIRPTQCKQWLIVVKERHSQASDEPENLIAAISTDGSQRQYDLSVGADFYGSPALSPNGRQLAWVEWKTVQRSPHSRWTKRSHHTTGMVTRRNPPLPLRPLRPLATLCPRTRYASCRSQWRYRLSTLGARTISILLQRRRHTRFPVLPGRMKHA